MGFCPQCGAILPLPTIRDNSISCYCCHREHPLQIYGDMKVEYTLQFNAIDEQKNEDSNFKSKKKEADGPIVKRKCPNCGNGKMSYATLQLRSADEGQTVFYTCTKCKFKEIENS